MVSICGGEPLIYPQDRGIGGGACAASGRIVYICTNGMFMRRKLRDYLAASYRPAQEPVLARLLAEGLITDKEAEVIRKGKTDGRPVIEPSHWLYWNVHIDGLEYTHDLIVEREGVFKECVEADEDGQDSGLPGRHQHHRLPRDRCPGTRGDVQVLLLARGGRAHHFARLRL